MCLDGLNALPPPHPPQILPQAPGLWPIFFFPRTLSSPVKGMALDLTDWYSPHVTNNIYFQSANFNLISGVQLNGSEPQLWIWTWVKVNVKENKFQKGVQSQKWSNALLVDVSWAFVPMVADRGSFIWANSVISTLPQGQFALWVPLSFLFWQLPISL